MKGINKEMLLLLRTLAAALQEGRMLLIVPSNSPDFKANQKQYDDWIELLGATLEKASKLN